MSFETQLKGLLGETGTREIRLTESPYDSVQHELCQTISQMIWGEKGLVESLGPTWGMVMDPRFAKCEMAWYKKVKVTASEHGYQESGLMVVSDDGTLASSRLISIEQYAEMLGEGRHFIEVLEKFKVPIQVKGEIVPPGRSVKDWNEETLLALIKQECPNYFDQKGKPNSLALVLVEMFKADLLGLVLDYAEVSNLDQWVFIESGDVAHDSTSSAAEKNPIAQAEIEYLDRALMYRAVLRANAIKVISKIGGKQLEDAVDGVVFTEMEKDLILQEVFKHPFDELYKALNLVLGLIDVAKKYPYEARERKQLGIAQEASKQHAKDIREGKIVPLDLLDGDASDVDNEANRFSKIRHDENLVSVFYMLIQAETLVNDYPGMQVVVDTLLPLINKAEAIPQDEFEALCEKVQADTDAATSDSSVCVEPGDDE